LSFLYLDSSAIAKLFLEEEHSALVESAIEAADGLVCSAIGYLEVMGLISRAFKQERVTLEQRDALVEAFELWWNDVTQMPLNTRFLAGGGGHAIRHGLRGIDGLHLYSVEQAQKTGPMRFACFDERLTEVAYAGGFDLVTDPAWVAKWKAAQGDTPGV